jgi:hypothetical protein
MCLRTKGSSCEDLSASPRAFQWLNCRNRLPPESLAEKSRLSPQTLHFVHQTQNHFNADQADATLGAKVFDAAQGADGLVVEVVSATLRITDRRNQAVFVIHED